MLRHMMRRLRRDEAGSALITALLCTMVMLGLGIALLAIVDTQASESGTERTRDRGFNLSESVLNSQAFVLGRNWPSTAPDNNPACNAEAAGFGDIIGADTTPSTATARLRANLNASYSDPAYAGATWQVNVCDDDDGKTVWDDMLLDRKNWDSNANSRVWVRAQSTVGDKTRVVVGLVNVRSSPALNARFGLVSGNLTDDLGTSINTVGSNALGGVLGDLLNTTPTVAPDPALTPTSPPSSGVIGLRCSAGDISLIPDSTCVSGTIGAAGALPAVSPLLDAGKIEQFPRITAASGADIGQLRKDAVASSTYYSSSPGGDDPASAPACEFTTNTGTRSASTVVFIEKVGNGDQYCSLGVAAGVQYKALVIGSGRVILRGDGTVTAAPVHTVSGPQVNTFSGVVYALNLQRHPEADGGLGLGDSASPGRVVVRIDNGAHVKGGVYADGKSAKVAIYPPPLTIDSNTLVDQLVPCIDLLSCADNALVKSLETLRAIVDDLIGRVGLTPTVNAILDQVGPERPKYGSAITADVAAIDNLKVYGASGVVPGTFRDLQAR